MKRFNSVRKSLALVGVLVTGFVMVFGLTGSASAASSYLYRNNGGSIWMSQQMNGNSGILIRSGTGFNISCWNTGPGTSDFGNYWTDRYFWGTAYTTVGARTGYVTASVVGNQTSVRHC